MESIDWFLVVVLIVPLLCARALWVDHIRCSVWDAIWHELEWDVNRFHYFSAMDAAAQRRGSFWEMYFDLRKWTFKQFYPNLGAE